MYQKINLDYTNIYLHAIILTDVVGKYFLEIYAIKFIYRVK